MKVIVATGNKDKAKEIREILRDMDAGVTTMKEAGFFAQPEENVAEEAARDEIWKDAIVIADDSGLVIDALNGEPGIYSARYLGHDTSYRVKNADLIRRLEGVSGRERSARFICAVAAVCPDGRVLTTEGAMEGQIGYEEQGENGFGYDPIFYLPEFDCTSAQLSPEDKNSISHRGKALRAMREKLGVSLEENR